jgi:peptide/nickel transport system substrate-binding protein
METSRRSLIGTTLFGSAAAFALSSCGMTPESTASQSAANRSTAPAKSTIAAAFSREIISLDPHGPSDVDEGTLFICRHIYDSLVVRSGTEYKPQLATKWENPDPLTWKFTIRDGVKFHDGSAVTANDVKASLERLAASKTPQAALWPTLKAVAAEGNVVTITTTSPLGTILANLSLLFVAPAAKLADASFWQKPVGSGPYKVETFTPSDKVHLVANADYWGTKGKTPRIESPYIPETSTRLTSLKNGSLDLTWTVPPDQLQSVASASGIKVVTTDSYVYYFNWFNCSRPPFTDARVRRAMWHAIDVPTVVKSLFGDTAKVATAPIPSTVFGHAPQTAYAYDPAKAKALLAEAGLPNGFSTHVMWSIGLAPQIKEVAQAFQQYWSKIGVTVALQELEQASWLKRLTSLDWDMDLQNNSSTTGDADYTLGRLYTSAANRMGYKNPELDDVLSKARAETKQDSRKELYAKACKIIWEDAVGIFPMDLTANYAMRSTVQGFVPAPNNQPVLTEVTA